MKKYLRLLAVTALAVAMLGCGGALAAGESEISVQLDGQDLTFTDALPQVKEQRIFLPFRAVFEAMGAQVSNEGSVITATRGGRTLTMTLDSTEAVLTEGDKTTSITMDVAPYVDNTVWRTYVPVRFAAQAFDCAVGWDQANSAAIIVDTEKLADGVMEGKRFTCLEKLMEFSGKYDKGIWDMEGSFAADMTVEAVPIAMSGSVKGTVQDGEKMSMDMDMQMDLAQFIGIASMSDAFKNESVGLTMRGDLAGGSLYMNMRSDVLEGLTGGQISSNNWYRTDMGADWAGLMKPSGEMDCAALVKKALTSMTLSDSATAYAEAKEKAEEIASSLSDEGFLKEDDRYTAVIAFEEEDSFETLILVMEMDKDTVTGYVMSMATETQEEGETVSTDMTVSMDSKDRMTAEMNMDMGGLLTMKMTMEGVYTRGEAVPATEPPVGANVVEDGKAAGSGMGATGSPIAIIAVR